MTMTRSMKRKRSISKDQICEEVCFFCKDGGKLLICDFKDCLKAYHPECAGKDESFSKTEQRWNCKWHCCFMCQGPAKYQCFCCPKAVCRRCPWENQFVSVTANRGFCSYCSRLARLIEENLDADSDGESVDFRDTDTYEYLFKEYWLGIKEKHSLSAEIACTAHNAVKTGILEVDKDIVSDYDDVESEDEYKPRPKKKGSQRQQCVKRKVEASKREFRGWGSKSLLEFLASMGKDISKKLSEYEVTSIVIDYCKANKLLDPEKKKKVNCDERLQSLLGRRTVNKNSICNLLTPHFAENLVDSTEEDESGSSSEDTDDSIGMTCKRNSKLNRKEPDVQKSCFAAITPVNIKLVYLKRSLVEQLLTQPETFDEKLIGSFVRVKCDPNDYTQKNTHQLLQIKGVVRSSRNDEKDPEVLLQSFGTYKPLPVSKLSDDDFCEEECEELHQRVKDGELKRPTIVELEQKARSLHEDITKHWIARELALLQKRIDQANEKGWRRQLEQHLDKKMLLETDSEQLRLLKNVPEVIAALETCDPTPSQDKQAYNGCTESAPEKFPQTPSTALANETSCCPHGNPAGSQVSQEISLKRDLEVTAAKCERKQTPSNFEQSSSIDGEPWTKKVLTIDNLTQFPRIPADETPEQVEARGELQTMICDSIHEDNLIVLSDDDDDADVSVQAPQLEVQGSDLWYWMGPLRLERGPYEMSLLKQWIAERDTESRSYEAWKEGQINDRVRSYKAWKEGQSKDMAILLGDAIQQNIS